MHVWIIFDNSAKINKRIADLVGSLLVKGNTISTIDAKHMHADSFDARLPDIVILGASCTTLSLKGIERVAAHITKAFLACSAKLEKLASWTLHADDSIASKHDASLTGIMDQLPAARVMPRLLGIRMEHGPGLLETGWQEKVGAFIEAFKLL